MCGIGGRSEERNGKTAMVLVTGVSIGHAAGRQSLTGSLKGRGRAVLRRFDLTRDSHQLAVCSDGRRDTVTMSSSHVIQVVMQGIGLTTRYQAPCEHDE